MFGGIVSYAFGRSVLMVLCAVVGFAIEDRWHARRVTTSNVLLNFLVGALGFAMEAATGITASLGLTALAIDVPGSGLLKLPTPAAPPWWSLIGLSFVVLVLKDVFQYGLHRAQHEWAWLWAIHELHHSDEEMNVTTAFRHHWLQKPAELVAITVPFGYVFAPVPGIVLTAFLLEFALANFIHLNARIRFPRGLRWLLVSPNHHRIHHSRDAAHRDRNFAAIFPVWDVLFGTYYEGGVNEYPATGVNGTRITTLRDAQISPFRRWAGW